MGYKAENYTTIPCRFESINPWVKNSTYFFGNAIAPTTSALYNRIYVPFTGTIRICRVFMYYDVTTGTAEAWPISVRVNNTTDYLVDTVSTAADRRTWVNTNLSIPVNGGDFIELKTVTPDWVTPPAGARGYAYLMMV